MQETIEFELLYSQYFKIVIVKKSTISFHQAHFIDTLPDITPMSTTLVYLNLSFNNFQVGVQLNVDIVQKFAKNLTLTESNMNFCFYIFFF